MSKKPRDIRRVLTRVLKKLDVTVDGVNIPLLNTKTETIVINTFSGTVVDVKPVLKFK